MFSIQIAQSGGHTFEIVVYHTFCCINLVICIIGRNSSSELYEAQATNKSTLQSNQLNFHSARTHTNNVITAAEFNGAACHTLLTFHVNVFHPSS